MSTICIYSDSFDMTRASDFGTTSLSALRYFRYSLFMQEVAGTAIFRYLSPIPCGGRAVRSCGAFFVRRVCRTGVCADLQLSPALLGWR